jgi:signal transduction histidine kinase
MNQLFYNLLGNALKFTAPGKAPVIEISVNELSNNDVRRYIKKSDPAVQYLLIRFADHGIGFDIKDAEQIFEVFKRLYTRQAYQGSGIGLALCRRIVLNHGGGLFAESEPGKGSTFNIILPKKHPRPGTGEKA